MIKFLFNGIINDRSRSLMPIIVISIGVMITVLMHTWITGIMGDSLDMNANFNNGHLKVVTKAYAKEANQMPIDLALSGSDTILSDLTIRFPSVLWVNRIKFGALIDFPDSIGETKVQGSVVGWAIDIFSNKTNEIERFNIRKSIIEGCIPNKPFEALISNDLAKKLKVKIGDKFTLFGTSMDGNLVFRNFVVSGTVRFGAEAIDNGAIIIDFYDAQVTFQMENSSSEILGFLKHTRYIDEDAVSIAGSFNEMYSKINDEYAPIMLTFKQQEGMSDLLDLTDYMKGIFILVFIMAMSVVLWNTGLIGSLRRYNEFGVRLALGESNYHIYKTLIYESFLIGFIGTVIGTIIGIFISYLIQIYGIDIGEMMKDSSLLMPSVIRTYITTEAFFIGIIPGVISMLLGNALAGLRIFKRSTAQLFKELEV